MFTKGHKINVGRKNPKASQRMIGNRYGTKLKGIKRSAETREKMSKYRKKHPLMYKLGTHLTEEEKLNLSIKRRAELNPNWQGGKYTLSLQIRDCYKMRQWRCDVFTRDDYTCQNCGLRGGYLEAHHIEMFSEIINKNNIKTIDEALACEELWNINNGTTLCNKCHNKTKHVNTNLS